MTRMPDIRAVGVLISAMLAGCAAHDSTLSKSAVQANPEPRLAKDVKVRVSELSTMLDQFSADLRTLPGKNDIEDRRSVAKLFGDLSEILPTVQGPNPGGAFRQQLKIVDSTRAQLAGESAKLSAEPTEDSGLRAVYNALSALQREQFYDHQEIGKTLADLRVKLDSLDTVRGPLHRSSVKEAMEQIGSAVRQMADVLNARLAKRV